MAFQSSTFVLVFTCLLLFTFSSSSAPSTLKLSATHKKINSICGQTQNPNFCISSLEGYLGDQKADMNRLGTVSILLARAQARLNKYVAEQLMLNVADPITEFHLGICDTDYGATIDRLQEAYRLSDNKDYKGMFDIVNDVNTMTNECIDQCLKLQNNLVLSLNEDNQKMVWLNSIASVILGMLSDGREIV